MEGDPSDSVLLLTDDEALGSALTEAFSDRPSDIRVCGVNGVDELFESLDASNHVALLIDADISDTDAIVGRLSECNVGTPCIAVVSDQTLETIPKLLECGIHDWIDRALLVGDPDVTHQAVSNRIRRVRSSLGTDPESQELLDALPVGVLWVDSEGTIRFVNRSVIDSLALEAGEIVGQSIESLGTSDDSEAIIDGIGQVQGEDTPDYHFIPGGGEDSACSISADALGNGTVVTVVEASERSAEEQALFEQGAFLDQLFEQVPINLYVKDVEGRHLRMSAHHPDSEEIIGKTDAEFYPEYLSEETFTDDMKVVENDEEILNKEEYNEPTGEWVLTSKVPWYDEDGNVAGIIGVTRDITERKEAQEALERTNERLERFASMVSHDLRNPLNVAKGRLTLLDDEVDSPHIEAVDTALTRMETLIEDILTVAREGNEIDDTSTVDLRSVCEDAWTMVDTRDATIRYHGSTPIMADRARLVQLLENLFRNAVEHGGDTVTVTVSATDDGFYVADDGPGIPQSKRKAVFEEGVSGTDGGTGLGLAIVAEIVRAHGWDLEVEESEAGGAKFVFDCDRAETQ